MTSTLPARVATQHAEQLLTLINISVFLMRSRSSVPVANVKFVPKKSPEADALLRPHFSTLFTEVSYLSQAAFSLANDRTYGATSGFSLYWTGAWILSCTACTRSMQP